MGKAGGKFDFDVRKNKRSKWAKYDFRRIK